MWLTGGLLTEMFYQSLSYTKAFLLTPGRKDESMVRYIFVTITTPPSFLNLSFRTIIYPGGVSSPLSMLGCSHVSVKTIMSGS